MRQKTIEKRNKFLTVGKELFFEKGYINVSVKEICDNLGTTTGSFYFMFSSKEKLLEELLLEDLGSLWSIGNEIKIEEKKLKLKGKLKLFFSKALEFLNKEMELMLFYENLLEENGIGGKTAQQIREINNQKQEDNIYNLYRDHKDEINHDDSMLKSLARYTVLIMNDKYKEIITRIRTNENVKNEDELHKILNTVEGLIRL